MLQAPSSARAQNFFISYNVIELSAILTRLSDRSELAFRRLQDHAVTRDGVLPDDDKLLARIVRMPLAAWRKAKAEILTLTRELVEVGSGMLVCLHAAKEAAFRIEKSLKASASSNSRWNAKSLKNNNQNDANASETHMRTQCSSTSSKKVQKEEPIGSSKKPSRGWSPFWRTDDEGQPLSEPLDAGPETPASEPEQPEVQAPPSSARPPRKPSAKRGAQVAEDWRPADRTVAWARNGTIGASDAQIQEQVEAFRDHHISKGTVFKDHDRAFQTWMRNAKRYGHLNIKAKPEFKSFKEQDKEREFCL